MRRRQFLAVAVGGAMAGCSSIVGGGESLDADGDGVSNEEDYAPWDSSVQSKGDVTGDDGGTSDTDGDGVIDSEDYAPRDEDVEEKADLSAPPAVHSAGVLEVEQTFAGNLDTGRQENEGHDFWFNAQTENERYLSPVTEAGFALGGSQPRGLQGCREASLSSDRIDVDELEGRYVCAKTNEGRYAEFYVDEVTPSPGVIRVAYTTWKQ